MTWLLRPAEWLFGLLPGWLARAIAHLLGWLWYWLVPVRRAVARDNLARALPGVSTSQRRLIARRCFDHLAQCGVEYLRLWRLESRCLDGVVERQGGEHLERALAAGRGVVVATAHLGNFDLMACSEALRGLELYIVTRRQHLGWVDRFWMERRRGCGLHFLPARRSIISMHRLLRRGKVVALMIDQHMPAHHGLVLDFFGRRASTTPAPALLAYQSGAALLPVCAERLPRGRHRVRIFPPLRVDTRARRRDEIRRLTVQLNEWLEQRIMERPEQWLWIHRRWKAADW